MDVYFYAPNAFEPWDHRNPDNPGIGGSETAVVELSRRLARRGHRVRVYANIRPDTKDDGPVRWRPLETANTAALGLWIVCRSPKSLDLFERRVGQQIWLQCQDTIYTEATGGGDITEVRAAKLDHVLALCDEHVRYIQSVYPFLADKIVLSSNGIKADAIEALEASCVGCGGAPQGHHGLGVRSYDGDVGKRHPYYSMQAATPRDPFRLIWASSPDRGLESTLKVFNRAREFEPRLSLHVCYGWDNIDKLIAQHGQNGPWAREKRKILALCGPGVVLRGRLGQRELWREYLQAGIWCYCTAFTETSCISCMEAQALGAIPVFTPIWALTQNVGHGISIEGQNSDPLVQARYVAAILRLVRQPELADAIRREMMPWARQRFDWEHVIDQYEALAGVRQEALCS